MSRNQYKIRRDSGIVAELRKNLNRTRTHTLINHITNQTEHMQNMKLESHKLVNAVLSHSCDWYRFIGGSKVTNCTKVTHRGLLKLTPQQISIAKTLELKGCKSSICLNDAA